jgi:hypothetical protein
MLTCKKKKKEEEEEGGYPVFLTTILFLLCILNIFKEKSLDHT